MTIPASKLRNHLVPGECVQLRTQNGAAVERLEYTEALRRAVQGEIEGVCTPSMRLRYVQILPMEQREIAPPPSTDIFDVFKSQPLNAVTNMGAYEQELNSGKVWALCLCRGLDGQSANGRRRSPGGHQVAA